LAVLMLIAKSNLVGCSTANLLASLPSGSCPPVRPMQAAGSFIDRENRRRDRGRPGGIVGGGSGHWRWHELRAPWSASGSGWERIVAWLPATFPVGRSPTCVSLALQQRVMLEQPVVCTGPPLSKRRK